MNRRGFLGSILAAGMAPAIVRADALMRVRPVDGLIWTPWSASDIQLDVGETVYMDSSILCRGPVEAIQKVWFESTLIWSSVAGDQLGLRLP